MSIHPLVLKEMEVVGWIKLDGTSYTPTERGKSLAQQLMDTGKYSERKLAQTIDPSITPLTKDEEREMIYQEMVKRAHEQLQKQMLEQTTGGTQCLSLKYSSL